MAYHIHFAHIAITLPFLIETMLHNIYTLIAIDAFNIKGRCGRGMCPLLREANKNSHVKNACLIQTAFCNNQGRIFYSK